MASHNDRWSYGSDDQEDNIESDWNTIKKPQITRKRKLHSQQNPARKRQHRRHFLLPTSSSDDTDGSVKSRASNYNSIEYHRRDSTSITSPDSRSTSITFIGLSAADKHVMDERSRQSQTKVAIALDQEEWEIEEILGEKKTKGKKGKQRTKFLVRWKNTWLDECDIDAPELFRKFRVARNAH